MIIKKGRTATVFPVADETAAHLVNATKPCRANGELLGRIILPEDPANLAWGEDGRALYFTARTSLYRLQTLTRGRILG